MDSWEEAGLSQSSRNTHSTKPIKRRREYRKQKRNKVCLYCNAPFIAKSGKARFCCSKHRVAYFRMRKREKAKRGADK